MRRKGIKIAFDDILILYWERFLHCQGCQALEKASLKSGGAAIPEGDASHERHADVAHGNMF